jgi:hypothetical protein
MYLQRSCEIPARCPRSWGWDVAGIGAPRDVPRYHEDLITIAIFTFAGIKSPQAQQPTPETLQQARQAYEQATARLEGAYLTAKAMWAQLYADWQALQHQHTAAATPAASVL